MKKKRFSESKIIEVLQTGEAGTPVADLCRKYQVVKARIIKEGPSTAARQSPRSNA